MENKARESTASDKRKRDENEQAARENRSKEKMKAQAIHLRANRIDSTVIDRKRVTSVLLTKNQILQVLVAKCKNPYCKNKQTKAGTIVENSAKLLSCLNVQSCKSSVS